MSHHIATEIPARSTILRRGNL